MKVKVNDLDVEIEVSDSDAIRLLAAQVENLQKQVDGLNGWLEWNSAELKRASKDVSRLQAEFDSPEVAEFLKSNVKLPEGSSVTPR